MMRDQVIAIAREMATERDLDPALILAIIDQESSLDPWAIRYEPAFYDRYVSPLVANGNLSKTEARLRAFSFGLMQVMGQTARETSFPYPFPWLFDPATNIDLGCRVWKKKLERAHGEVRQALLYWNGGGNQAYDDEVLARMAQWA